MSSIDDTKNLLKEIDATIDHYYTNSTLVKKDIRSIERLLRNMHQALMDIISLPEEKYLQEGEKKIQAAKNSVSSISTSLWNVVHIDHNPKIKNVVREANTILNNFTFPSKDIEITSGEVNLKTLTPDEYYFAEDRWETSSELTIQCLENLHTNFMYSFLQQHITDKDLLFFIWNNYFSIVKKLTDQLIAQKNYTISKDYFDSSEMVLLQIVKKLPTSLSQEEINTIYYCLLNTHSEFIRELFGAPQRTQEDLELLREMIEREASPMEKGEMEETLPFIDEENLQRSSMPETPTPTPIETIEESSTLASEETILSQEEEIQIVPSQETEESLHIEVEKEEEVPLVNISEEVTPIEASVINDVETSSSLSEKEEPQANLSPQEEVDAFVLQAKAFVKAGFDKILKVYEKVHPELLTSIPNELSRYNKRLLHIKKEIEPIIALNNNTERNIIEFTEFTSIIPKDFSLYKKIDAESLKSITHALSNNEVFTQLLSKIDTHSFPLFQVLEEMLPPLREVKEIEENMQRLSQKILDVELGIRSYENLRENKFHTVFHGIDPHSLFNFSQQPLDTAVLEVNTQEINNKIEKFFFVIDTISSTVLRPLLEEDFQKLLSSFKKAENSQIEELETLYSNLEQLLHFYKELLETPCIKNEEHISTSKETPPFIVENTSEEDTIPVTTYKTVRELRAKKEKESPLSMSLLKTKLYDLANILLFWERGNLYGKLEVENSPFEFRWGHKIVLHLLHQLDTTYPSGLNSTQICGILNAIINVTKPTPYITVSVPDINALLKSVSHLNYKENPQNSSKFPILHEEYIDEGNGLISTYKIAPEASEYFPDLTLPGEYIMILNRVLELIAKKKTPARK